jgi:SAM-dependent methyltransferase
MTNSKNPSQPVSPKAAMRGEPSYIWRAGQDRRLALIRKAAGDAIHGRVLEDGCGVGQYLAHLEPLAKQAVGVELEFDRAEIAYNKAAQLTCGAAEKLPFPANTFNLLLSHEVLEHVRDDRQSVAEMVRVLKPGGRIILFVPNRGYPFETHGIYWRGKYSFGNKIFVNYLPRKWRDSLTPHVRVYSSADLEKLLSGFNLKVVDKQVLFGAYDNLIKRFGPLGRALRAFLQSLEKTPLRIFGLSHFWVLEKER